MPEGFDVEALKAKLKARGLDLAEEAAKEVASDICDWLQESLPKSKVPFAGFLAGFVPELKKLALGLADQIDGKVGE